MQFLYAFLRLNLFFSTYLPTKLLFLFYFPLIIIEQALYSITYWTNIFTNQHS